MDTVTLATIIPLFIIGPLAIAPAFAWKSRIGTIISITLTAASHIIFWLIMGSILMRELGIFTYAAAWEIATLVTISCIAVDAREIPWHLRKPK
ncbi:hypothetical protein HG434_002290 [Candidatus Saccharibacteria bacterium]|nr:hypothetical protein [Candidatus Saccharibacteria bacterium]